ncbi:MAG: HmuY family protein [Deltaproteobacteria bacterium]|nr:HmuY family protein [Deltaproteobacteria bacterium]
MSLSSLRSHRLGLSAAAVLLALGLNAGCGSDDAGDPNPLPSGNLCDTPVVSPCMDQAITQAGLKGTVAKGLITNASEGNGVWASEIDATAGGLTPTESYVYAAFGDAGLVKLNLDDESAFNDMVWDVAFRRFVIRINSGDSGPSCDVAAVLGSNVRFDSVTLVPTSLTYYSDDFMSDPPACTMNTDASGMNSPAVFMGGFWHHVNNAYGGCLQMTDQVYILQVRSGRHVRFTVTHYYNATPQEACDTDPASFNAMGQGSGHVGVRWAFLD